PDSRNGPRGTFRTFTRFSSTMRVVTRWLWRRPAGGSPANTTVPRTWLSRISGEIAVTLPGYVRPSYWISARVPGVTSRDSFSGTRNSTSNADRSTTVRIAWFGP